MNRDWMVTLKKKELCNYRDELPNDRLARLRSEA
jgi:hypothetical protein